MKKFFLISALLLGGICFAAQADLAKVKLKNGVELTGTLISMDPTDKIVIEIGGTQSTIKMTDVESVEKVVEPTAAAPTAAPAAAASPEDALPKEKTVNIAGHDMKFILVPSNTFSYGYDGPGSRVIDSEPVHEVEVAPFYVSADPVSVDLAKDIIGSDPWSEYTYGFDDNGLKIYAKAGLDFAYEKDLDKVKKIAFFFPSFNKMEIQNGAGKLAKEGESFPSAKAFISALQEKAGKDVKLLNEVQYASLIKQEIDGVNFPMNPEVMMSVYMNERKNPSVNKYMTKGLDMIVYPGGFRSNVKVSKLDYRASLGMHKVDKKKKVVKFYSGLANIIGPTHLVIPAK